LNADKDVLSEILNMRVGQIQQKQDISDKLAKFDSIENERLKKAHKIREENIDNIEYNMQDELNKYKCTIYE